ncbi:MAG: hypothetical protein ACRDYE_04785 [Acidimicrobiales bacterium]
MRKLTATAWLLTIGLIVAAIGTLLPWEQDQLSINVLGDQINSGSASRGPSNSGGALFLLLALIAVSIWLSWPALSGRSLSPVRAIGLTVMVAILTFFAIAKFAALGSANEPGVSYHAGLGLLLYTAAIVLTWVGVIRVWLNRPSALATGSQVYGRVS